MADLHGADRRFDRTSELPSYVLHTEKLFIPDCSWIPQDDLIAHNVLTEKQFVNRCATILKLADPDERKSTPPPRIKEHCARLTPPD